MGNYLNSIMACDAFVQDANSPYFVDKSLLIGELIPRIETNANYICITRPRRFGKTVAANMLAAFFSRARDTRKVFDGLKISDFKQYEDYIGKYDIIFISLNELPRKCQDYESYITRIEDRLLEDLKTAYPKANIRPDDAVWDALSSIYNAYDSKRFIFILDEWDFIFHRDFIKDQDKKAYIDFLSNLLKGKAYVSLAYMTGILPIAKYSSGSELNMFLEYTMAAEELFGNYFGFTETEVDMLYKKYLAMTPDPMVTREGLKEWYDGYSTKYGERVYNPRSVVAALTNNNLGNYWTSSGPYDEIFYYIEHNTAAVKDDLARMVSGEPVDAKIREYAATSMNLSTKDEIFSAMVVYGFLSYDNGYVQIPNRELMEKFDEILLKEPSLGYVYQLAGKSAQMLKATLQNDTDTMVEILEFAHNTEIPLLSYNNEADLTALVNLVYLSARDSYRIEREDKAGKGYVDFIFYPETDKHHDGIIIELKIDSNAQAAIDQIRQRQYVLKFQGNLGGKERYTGRMVGVGIGYDKKRKTDRCKVEVVGDGMM